MIDAFRITKFDVGLISFTNAEKKAADVNGDGEVNMIDALRIQKFDAGLADTLR